MGMQEKIRRMNIRSISETKHFKKNKTNTFIMLELANEYRDVLYISDISDFIKLLIGT